MIAEHLTQASYLLAPTLFILSLRWLKSPSTARRDVVFGAPGEALFAALHRATAERRAVLFGAAKL